MQVSLPVMSPSQHKASICQPLTGLLTFGVFFPSAYISTSGKCLDSHLTSFIKFSSRFFTWVPFQRVSLLWEICHKLSIKILVAG